jgi:hypothetical protein
MLLDHPNTIINWCNNNSNVKVFVLWQRYDKSNVIDGSAKKMATMTAMSILAATMATAVVATEATVMTAPTKKHGSNNDEEHLPMKTCNTQSSSNTKTEHTTFHGRST